MVARRAGYARGNCTYCKTHRMSAHYRNAYDEMNRTRRFALAAFPAYELPTRRRRERRRKAKTR